MEDLSIFCLHALIMRFQCFFFHAWGNTFWQSSIADIADYLLVVAEVTKNKSIKNSKNCVEIIGFLDMK